MNYKDTVQLKRVLIQGLKNLLRNRMMVLASLLVTVLTMLVIGVCYIVVQNINHQMDSYINKEYTLSVYLNEDIDDAGAAEFEKILKADERIKLYEYISKEKAYNNYKSNFPEKSFDSLFKDRDKDFLPVSFNIILHDSDKTHLLMEDLQAVTYKVLGIEPSEDAEPDTAVVRESSSTESLMADVERVRNIVYGVGVGVTGLLMFFAFIIISNTIMLSIFARKKEIEIMNHIGATRAYIQGPYIVEGCAIGFGGAVLAYFLLELIYNILLKLAGGSMTITGTLKLELVEFGSVSAVLIIVLLLIGMVMGGVGAMLSAGKNIKN